MPRRKKPAQTKPQFHLETLERRILFSADAAFSALDLMPGADSQLVMWEQSQTSAQTDTDSFLPAEVRTHELVVVDSAVADINKLLSELGNSGLKNSQLLVLDKHSDALTQISETLEQQRDLTVLRLVSPASDEAVELGGKRYDTVELLSRAEELVRWRAALAPGAEILLDGGDIESDGAAPHFANTLARLTGANVSISDSQTGAVETTLAARTVTSATTAASVLDDTFTITLADSVGLNTTVPASQTIKEGEVLAFVSGTDTEISVDDPLATNSSLQVTLSVNDGIVHLSSLMGLAITTGADRSSNITVSGTESDINAALDAMTFTPDTDFAGSVLLSVATLAEDGAETSDNVRITVNAVNDAPTFNVGNGTVELDSSLGESIGASYHLSNGKTLVVGAKPGNVSGQLLLTQVNADGSLDDDFGNNGYVYTDFGGPYEFGTAVQVQSDGKILVGGTRSSTLSGDDEDFAVARYNVDGTLDTSFAVDGKVVVAVGTKSDRLHDIVLQVDGKILLTGESDNGSSHDLAVVRLNTDGSLDSSFDVDGKLTLAIGTGDHAGRAVQVQSDGQIVVGGYLVINDTNHDAFLVRLNTDGTLDTNFGIDGVVTTDYELGSLDQMSDFVFDDEGRTVSVGHDATHSVSVVSRYLTDGSLDLSFGINGLAKIDTNEGDGQFIDVVLQPNGQIVAAGYAYSGSDNDVLIARFDNNGTLDTTFGTAGLASVDFGSNERSVQTHIDASGDIIVSVQLTDAALDIVGGGLIRLNSDGTTDQQFNSQATLTNTPTYVEDSPAVILDSDVQVYDVELTGYSDFEGSTLTLQRNSSSNSEDVFSATGNVSFVGGSSFGDVTLSSDNVGTYIQEGGRLVLEFAMGTSNAQVNEVLQSVAYSNSSDTPPASVQISWTFDDGGDVVQTQGGSGLTASGSTTVNIVATNDAPSMLNISNSTIVENTDTTGGLSIGVLTSTDADDSGVFSYSVVDGMDSSVFSVGGAALDELILSDGVINYESKSSYEVTIRTSDPDGSTYDQLLVIEVTDENEAPTQLEISNNSIAENTDTGSGSSIGTLSITDVDEGETFTYAVTGGADEAVFNIGGASFDELILIDGVLDFEAQARYNVTVEATDSGGLSHAEAFVISVTDINEPPTLVQLSNDQIAENIDTQDGVVLGKFDSTDDDPGEVFSYSVTGGVDADVFSVGGVDADELILTDGLLDFESQASYSVTITVTDSQGLTYDQMFTISVTDVNDKPFITSTSVVSLAENQTRVLTVSSSDSDGGNPEYTLTGGNDVALFAIDKLSGELQFNVVPDFETPGDANADNTYNVEVWVSDGKGGSDSQNISITIIDVNEAPVIDPVIGNAIDEAGSELDIAVDENQTVAISVSATDPDEGAELRYTLTGGADQSAFTIDVNTGVLSFISSPDYEIKNRYEVDITVSDNEELQAVQTVVINIRDVNESPTAQTDRLDANENQLLVIDPVASMLSNDSDPEQDDLYLVSFTQPQNGTLTLNSSDLLEYVPAEDFTGIDSFDYVVMDSAEHLVSATVMLDVKAFSDPALAAALPESSGAVDGTVDKVEVIFEKNEITQPVQIALTGITATSPISPEPAAPDMFTETTDNLEAVDPVAPARPDGDNQAAVSGTLTTDTVFTDLKSVVVEQQVSTPTDQPLPDSPVEAIVSRLLSQLLQHDVLDLDSSFELNIFEQSVSVELRDAIITLRGQVDRMLDQPDEHGPLMTYAPSVVGASLSAGIVTWVLRSGLLISATITATPLWRPLDPVAILARSADNEPWYANCTQGGSSHRAAAANDPDNENVNNG